MPKKPGQVCTRCTRRLTAPCNGANTACPYYNSKRRNFRGAVFNGVIITLWLLFLTLLAFGCEPDQYEQIEPKVERYRDTGIITVPNPVDYPWVLTHEVIKIGKNYYIPTCLNNKDTLELVTAPVISFWREPRAAQTFEKCKK